MRFSPASHEVLHLLSAAVDKNSLSSFEEIVFVNVQERAAALEALSRIHDAGVLHGDPQLQNLMVQRDQVRQGLESALLDLIGA